MATLVSQAAEKAMVKNKAKYRLENVVNAVLEWMHLS